MRINVGDVRLFFDVEGAKLRPEGSVMREVPTLLLLLGGPGFDHSGFKPDFSQVTDLAQLVYLDLRGGGRSDRGVVERWNLDQCAARLAAEHRRSHQVRLYVSDKFLYPTPKEAGAG